MTTAPLTYPVRARRWSAVLRTTLKLCAIAIASTVVILVGGGSWNFFFFLLACTVFVGSLSLARPLSGSTLAGERNSFLLANLVIWVFLMISEAIFTHNQSTASAAKGNVGNNALYQAVSWILSFFGLAFVSWFRPAYLRRLFTGPLKWAAFFAIVAVVSSPLSQKPAYSLALAFKLSLIVFAVSAITEAVSDEAAVFRFYVALFVGMLISVTAEFLAPFFRPGEVFADDGRLGFMIGLSGTCGILLLLCVLLLWITKNPWFLLCGLYSVVVMMLAGTKGGMVASFVSLMMFFLMLKKPAQALAVSFVFTGILIFCVIFTPLGKNLEKYSESGNAGTLTGRTNLWSVTWPEITSHPIFGKAYRASRFLSEDVPGTFQEAGNMHNSFMEVLYNNGLAGLIPVAVMNLLIVVNLRRVLIRPSSLQVRYFAAAAFALYTHLFVWGLVAVTYGGPPDNRFMTFIAVLAISMFLRTQCDQQYRNTIHGKYFS